MVNTNIETALWEIKRTIGEALYHKLIVCNAYLYLNNEGSENKYLRDAAIRIINANPVGSKDIRSKLNNISREELEANFLSYYGYDYLDYGKYVYSYDNVIKIIKSEIKNHKNNRNILIFSTGLNIYYNYLLNNFKDDDIRICNVLLEQEDVDLMNMIKEITGTQQNICNEKIFENKQYDFDLAIVEDTREYGSSTALYYDNSNGFRGRDLLPYNHTMSWESIEVFLNSLNDQNKIIAITSNKALDATQDDKFRSYIIANRLLNKVVSLPFKYSNSPCSALVFNKNNNFIKIVDTKNCKTMDINSFIHYAFNREDGIKNYNDLLTEIESEGTIIFTAEKLLINRTRFYNNAKLSDICQVSTGSQYTSSNFKSFITKEDTGLKLLAPSDIVDGTIDYEKLPNLSSFNNTYANGGDVIITNKSTNIKIAVIEPSFHEYRMCLTGGMFRLSTENYDKSYFLKMFFESEVGQNKLKSIQKGLTIPVINLKDLRSLELPRMEEHEYAELGHEYKGRLERIKELQYELDKAKEELKEFTNKTINEFVVKRK